MILGITNTVRITAKDKTSQQRQTFLLSYQTSPFCYLKINGNIPFSIFLSFSFFTS
jgi:hypothetical protein